MPWYTPCMIPSPWCRDCGLSLLLWCISFQLWVSIRWQRQRDFGAIISKSVHFESINLREIILEKPDLAKGGEVLQRVRDSNWERFSSFEEADLLREDHIPKTFRRLLVAATGWCNIKIGKSVLQTQKLDSVNDLYGSGKTLSSGSEHTPADTWLQLWETLPVTRVIF